jgi:hypothetical protein
VPHLWLFAEFLKFPIFYQDKVDKNLQDNKVPPNASQYQLLEFVHKSPDLLMHCKLKTVGLFLHQSKSNQEVVDFLRFAFYTVD